MKMHSTLVVGERAAFSTVQRTRPLATTAINVAVALNVPTEDKKLRRVWKNKLEIGKNLPHEARVCSSHFSDEDFKYSRTGLLRQIKDGAVPSQKLPVKSLHKFFVEENVRKKSRADCRNRRWLGAIENLVHNGKTQNLDSIQSTEDICEDGIPHESFLGFKTTTSPFRATDIAHLIPLLQTIMSTNTFGEYEKNNLTHLIKLLGKMTTVKNAEEHATEMRLEPSTQESLCNTCSSLRSIFVRDTSLQATCEMRNADVETDRIEEKIPTYVRFNVTDCIKTNSILSTFSGMNSLTGFEKLAALIDTVLVRINYTVAFTLDTRELLLLCLMKLKTGLPFVAIAALFHLSVPTCIKYFHFMVDVLYLVLNNAVCWPCREEVEHTTPHCFEKYPRTRVIIDCTEVYVQKVQCIDCRVKMYSFYYGGETMKFLVGIAPSGRITFISAVYGGRASDKFIVNDCGFLDKLEPEDEVMADKGFLIEDELANIQCKLIQPPFLGKRERLDRSEGIENVQIARVRVHVERAIQRIKVFRILHNVLPSHLLCKADKIVTVIAGLVNLQPPIIADEPVDSTNIFFADDCNMDVEFDEGPEDNTLVQFWIHVKRMKLPTSSWTHLLRTLFLMQVRIMCR